MVTQKQQGPLLLAQGVLRLSHIIQFPEFYANAIKDKDYRAKEKNYNKGDRASSKCKNIPKGSHQGRIGG